MCLEQTPKYSDLKNKEKKRYWQADSHQQHAPVSSKENFCIRRETKQITKKQYRIEVIVQIILEIKKTGKSFCIINARVLFCKVIAWF